MKLLLKFYVSLVVIFMAAKLCFMAFNVAPDGAVSAADAFAVLVHGLPLDLATAGYFTAPVWLFQLLSIWIPKDRIGRARAAYFNRQGQRVHHIYYIRARVTYKAYLVFVTLLLTAVFVGDTCLYGFWGIKLDGTVFNYLGQPGGAVNSVSASYIALVLLAALLTGALIFIWLSRLPRLAEQKTAPRHRLLRTAFMLLVGGLLFLAIRGGVGRSTANVGMVYYSDRLYLNHCAVNPVFSVVSSLFKTKDFASEHNVFPEEERARLFADLHYSTAGHTTDTLLRTSRPNVLLIIMEGCGGVFVNAVDSLADPNITPRLNQLAREGVVFTNCYANSFRTDRGTVCALSGYPAFPDVSVMKVPSRRDGLPSIARSLKAVGYQTEFLYGGDIDFTGTNGYLRATGYQHTFGDKTFTASERATHGWGVTDRITFARLLEMVKAYPQDRPWHTGFLTLASHEPWGVPYARIAGDTIANAMAYLDDCVGQFIDSLRRLPQWDNTLVILLPDHGINYPASLRVDNPRKCHIPLIWTGGAIRAPRRITTLMNQTDLCATLLGQMGIDHSAFRFSRNVLADTYTHPCAIHVWSEGILWLDSSGHTALNLVTRPPSILQTSTPADRAATAKRAKAANAFLQTCYDDLGR